MYYTIEIDNEILTDEDGNTLKFETHHKASEYLFENYIYEGKAEYDVNAFIVRQY
jgi:hypothetical protein